MITQAELKELFSYNKETGYFKRIKKTPNSKIKDIAGNYDRDGYVLIYANKKTYRAHRLAWFYVHGIWPTKNIDHINGIRNDNRIINLREASMQENSQNLLKARSCNKLGILGVYERRDCPLNPFTAIIKHNNKRVYLGHYSTKEEAHNAYLVKKREIHQFCTI